MRNRIGELFIGLGLVHLVVVLLDRWGVLGAIVRDGYVNAVGDDWTRSAAFWLLSMGMPYVVVGVVARWAQRRTGTVPEALGWLTVLNAVIGVLAIPRSGFWFVLAIGLWTVAVARRDPAHRVATAAPVP